MGRIYEDEEDYYRAFEEDMRKGIEELGIYQGEVERQTLDGEWDETDLVSDVEDLAMEVLGDSSKKGWLFDHKYSAVKDKNLLYDSYVSTRICEENDVIEIYNAAVDKHRNDDEKLFGIHYFDDEIKKLIKKLLDDNLA